MTNPLIVHIKDGIATVSLNRPEKRNALNLEMWKKIPVFLNELKENSNVKVIIIKGIDDRAFSAGADISEFAEVRFSADQSRKYDQYLTSAGDALQECPKPIIALVQRHCIGGACEIALACDLRFSSENGIFGITPAKLGIVYGVPQTKRLIDIVGPSRAKDILFSSRFLDAQEAYEIGLIDRVYKDEEIVEKTYEYAKVLSMRSQVTIQGAKKIISNLLKSENEKNKESVRIVEQSYNSEDYREGVQAFLEKRQPNFKCK
jgi:enoyl-CoA hydratase/carnithine racemase